MIRCLTLLYFLAGLLVLPSAYVCAQDDIQENVRLEAARIQSQFQNQPSGQASAVAPASLTTPAYAMERPYVASADSQIRVNIRLLQVDESTREKIYELLSETEIKTRTDQNRGNKEREPLIGAGSSLKSNRVITTSACISTGILTTEQTRQILQLVADSPASSSKSPSVILIDGQEGQIKDIVQRPFVVGLDQQPVKQDVPGAPVVQVLDEGTDLRVQATKVNAQTFHVASEIQYKKILEFDTMRVFGSGLKDAVIQVPKHRIETATASDNVAAGQVFLIDPYVSRTVRVTEERGVPVLGKIPYVNRAFKNVAMTEYNLNQMVLIQPIVE